MICRGVAAQHSHSGAVLAHGLQFQSLSEVGVRSNLAGGAMEWVLVILGLYFLVPVILATIALTQVKALRRKLEDQERFSAGSELRSPRLFPSLVPAGSPPLMPVEEPEEV